MVQVASKKAKTSHVPETCTWNAAQLEFIRQPFDSHGKLVGIPGAGKTTTILERCEHWKRELQLEAKHFLILMFSKQACSDFKAKAKHLKLKGYSDKNVRTIHSCAGSILHKLDAMSALQTCVTNAADALTADIVAQLPALQHVRNVIVDEAQDLSAEQYGLVMKLAQVTSSFVTMVGDPDQAIFGFQGGDVKHLLEHPGFTVYLTVNYRCSPPIVAALNQVRNKALPPMTAAQELGNHVRPVLMHADLATLERQLLGHTAAYVQQVVAVLGPVKLAKPRWDWTYTSLGLQWAAEVLRCHGVPLAVHYVEGDRTMVETSYKTCLPGSVHLFTLHGSKGLEFDTVVALNFHAATMGTAPPSTAVDLSEKENLWRVGMSRAKSKLYLYTLQDNAVWFSYDSLHKHVDVHGPRVRMTHWKPWGSKNPPRGWTDVLNQRDVVPERCLAELENVAGLQVVQLDPLFIPTWTVDELPQWSELAMVYGLWAESVVFAAMTNSRPPIYGDVYTMIYHRLVVPGRLTRAMKKLLKRVNGDPKIGLVRDVHSHVLAEAGKDADTTKSGELLTLLRAWCDANPDIPNVFLAAPNIVQHFDEAADKAWFSGFCAETSVRAADLWKLCLYQWQHCAEAGYRWSHDYTRVFEVLATIFPVLQAVGCEQRAQMGDVDIHRVCTWPCLYVGGETDLVCTTTAGDEVVVELKFATQTSVMHYLQAWGYGLMLNIPKVEVWNLMTGERGCACWAMETLLVQREACETLLKPFLCA